MEREIYIIDAVRTPIGRFQGALSTVRPDDLAAHVIQGMIHRNPELVPSHVEDVILGCANQAGEDNRNIARMAALLAGLPESVGGCTVNRLCGSGLEAINQATASMKMGCGDVMIAGGVESMSRAPLVMLKPEMRLARGDCTLVDTTLGWRFVNPQLAMHYDPISMGETAENVAERYAISREDQDQYALLSQKRCKRAQEEDRFQNEIHPIVVQEKGMGVKVSVDEHPRPNSTLDTLATLPAIFRANGSITAGNSSGLNDGASALLLMEGDRMRQLGMRPMARVVSFAVSGVHPHYMGIGPVEATKKVLERTGMCIQDIDIVEINEAFAAQVVACMRLLDLNVEKVNVNGGAIALGHPLGASGARLMTTLVHELQRCNGRFGLVTMCIGVGQGIATLIERIPTTN